MLVNCWIVYVLCSNFWVCLLGDFSVGAWCVGIIDMGFGFCSLRLGFCLQFG